MKREKPLFPGGKNSALRDIREADLHMPGALPLGHPAAGRARPAPEHCRPRSACSPASDASRNTDEASPQNAPDARTQDAARRAFAPRESAFRRPGIPRGRRSRQRRERSAKAISVPPAHAFRRNIAAGLSCGQAAPAKGDQAGPRRRHAGRPRGVSARVCRQRARQTRLRGASTFCRTDARAQHRPRPRRCVPHAAESRPRLREQAREAGHPSAKISPAPPSRWARSPADGRSEQIPSAIPRTDRRSAPAPGRYGSAWAWPRARRAGPPPWRPACRPW